MKRKKRKNKSIVALMQKRKTFLGLFIRRWIAVLVLSAIGLSFAEDLFVEEMQDTWKNMYYWAKDAIIETINKGTQDESYEMYINRIELAMALRQETRTASLLCNAETGEIIADCKEQIFLFKRVGEEKSIIYTCPTSDIEGWDEYREKFVANKGKSYYLSENEEMDHIYVKGAHFLPGAFKITNRPYDITTGESTGIFPIEVLVTEFEEPKNLTDDYVKTELTDEWTLSLIYGYNKNDTTLYSGSEEGYQELQNAYQRFLHTGNTPISGELYTEQKIIIFGDNEIVMPNGEKAILMTAYYYDVWEDYGTQEIIVVVITLVVGLLLALIWARLAYVKLKAGYDMEDYRKTLMNTMAHDLKSPLMSISGYAENLRDNVNTDKREHYSEAILGNVKYMNHIIESVLALGKTENAALSLKKAKTSIKPIFLECAKKYDLQMKEKKLTLNIEGDVELNIDASLFAQAVDNLLGNAVKFASEDSPININIKDKVIAIANNCNESPDVDVDALCQPFVVGNVNRSDKTGTGLGLAIVNNICQLHGMKLELKYMENVFIAQISK